MELTELLEKVANAFEKHRVPFILIGRMAVATWVRQRPTDDEDASLSAVAGKGSLLL